METVRATLRRWWIEIGVGVIAAFAGIDAALHPTGLGVDKGDPDWLVVALPGLIALPLFLRKTFPFGAPLASIAVAIAGSFVFTAEAIVDGAFGFFIVLIASVLLSSLDRRSAALGLAAAYATVWLINSQNTGASWADYVFPLFFFTAFWVGAQTMRARGDRLREAESRANELAARREEQAQIAVADERARIARELHDVVGHSVSVMTVQASAVRRLLRPEQAKEREALLVVEETGRQALAEMRRMVGVLRDPGDSSTRAPQPSLEQVEVLFEKARQTGLSVDVRVEGERRALAPGIDLTAYRIVQEALTNVAKHSGAETASVVLAFKENGLEIAVTDDGRGARNGASGGHGLVGMRERVSVVGGELEAGPSPDGGYRVCARLPLT